MTPERQHKLTAVLNKRQPDITVIMENVHDPHNIAAVMRSCDAIGIQDIYIIKPEFPDRKNWGARSSSSANKWLTVHTFDNTETCMKEVRKHFDRIFTTKLEEDAANLYEMDFTESVALVFGNEKDGVSDEACDLADGNFIIPQVGMISSLNISVACAVTLYEAYRQKSIARHYERPKFDSQNLKDLKKHWRMY